MLTFVQCYSVDDYMSIAGYSQDSNGNLVLPSSDLSNIYPVIIEQVMSSACGDPPAEDNPGYTEAMSKEFSIKYILHSTSEIKYVWNNATIQSLKNRGTLIGFLGIQFKLPAPLFILKIFSDTL